MKYDRIVEIRKQKSHQKVELARTEIKRMQERGKWITVTALVKQTGLSEGFFYKNLEVRKMVQDAARRQKITVCNSQESISKIALEEEILNLKMTIKILNLKVEQLERQNKKLINENKMLKGWDGEQYEVR